MQIPIASTSPDALASALCGSSFVPSDVEFDKQVALIKRGFRNICANNDFVVVEGTGHVGVGSVIGLSNARVARELGIDMVLVAKGGIGSTFDELELNRQVRSIA